jgi:hypothetical protein
MANLRTVTSALIAAAVLAACGSTPPKTPSVEGKSVAVSMPALDGGTIETARYRGKIVVLHLFTTWSVAAQADVEQLLAAHDAYSDDDLVIVGIGMDVDGYDLVSPWRSANSIPYLIGVATEAMHRGQSPLGKISQVPTTIVIDRRGTVVRHIHGPLSAEQLPGLISGLISRK